MLVARALTAAALAGAGAQIPAAWAADTMRTPLSSHLPGMAHRQQATSHFERSYQAPSLWYYGSSYSSYYTFAPPRTSSGSSTYYTPSLGYDPFYGHRQYEYGYRGYGAPDRWRRY
jgi:hypothetical protein